MSLPLAFHSSACIAGAALLSCYVVVLLRTAWVQDDAYITFRTVHNFCSGYGLTWNPSERVQTNVHALWTLLLAALYACTREIYYSSLFLSMVLAAASYGIVVFLFARGGLQAVVGGALLVLSKAFVDFSTSGLENPATYFLLCLLILAAYRRDASRRKAFQVSLLASLVVLNRLDLVLLVAPLVLGTVLAGDRRLRSLQAALLGGIPLVAWGLFALLYYGTVLPNPAQAKVFDLDIGRAEMLRHGGAYLADSLWRDPLTLCTVAAAAVVAAIRRERVSVLIMLGALFQVAYVVWIGGDFMSGRFVAVPFLASVIVLCRALPPDRPRAAWVALGFVLLLGVRALPSTLLSGRDYESTSLTNPAGQPFMDCRGFYFQGTGLLNEGKRWPNLGRVLPATHQHRAVLVMRAVGKPGFASGPKAHVVDLLALCDPLLSRMPPAERAEDWMSAHLRRHIPAGYLHTLRTGTNRLVDPSLAEYYRRIQLLTQGPLFAPERLRTILGFAVGEYDALLEAYLAGSYQDEIQSSVRAEELSTPVADGLPWYSEEVRIMNPYVVLRVILGSLATAPAVELSLDANDLYVISFVARGNVLGTQVVQPASSSSEAGMRTVRLDVPPRAAASGYDEVAVFGSSGDGVFAIGHVRPIPDG